MLRLALNLSLTDLALVLDAPWIRRLRWTMGLAVHGDGEDSAPTVFDFRVQDVLQGVRCLGWSTARWLILHEMVSILV